MTITIFLHIPKTGGGAFDNRARTLFDNPAPRLSWAEAQEKPFDYWTQYDYISGHYPMSFIVQFRNAGIDILTVMLMRDPVARVLSHWAYVHERGYWRDPDFQAWLQSTTLEEWLKSDRTLAHTDLQTRFLCDRVHIDNGEIYRLAQVDVLGIQNRTNGLQDAMDDMCNRLDKPSPTIVEVANVSHGIPLYTLKPDTLATIQAQNEKDIALYEIVLDIVNERVMLEVGE
jgi:hypothetical protein